MKSKLSWVRRSQRMIRMVSELHRMGYQRLRIMPYAHPLAWRLAIAPAEDFCVHNGAALRQISVDVPVYSSASEDAYFDWTDTSGDNARQLAEKFVQRFPGISERGRGRDWAYAGWLAELVGFLEGGDFLPVMEWEHMLGKAEDLRFLPVWEIGSENTEWINEKSDPVSIPAQNGLKLPLPPDVDSQIEAKPIYGMGHWADDPYWRDAHDRYLRLRDDGKRSFSISLPAVEASIFNGDSPAYKLMEAMVSVMEHEGNQGLKGAPRLMLAVLPLLEKMGDGGNR